MIKLIISGSSGKMGEAVANVVLAKDNIKIVAGIAKETPEQKGKSPFPVFETPLDCNIDADIVIDFSHPDNFDDLLNYCIAKNLPLVSGTTGLTDAQNQKMKQACTKIPLFYSSNMSLGVFVLNKLVKMAAKDLANFDIEIIERHHNLKIDAPSGTAISLLNSVKSVLPNAVPVYDRHNEKRRRQPTEVGMHCLRGGTIVGTHDVIYAGRGETVEIRHNAESKEIFASGAVRAAEFLMGKNAGFYNMESIIG